MYLGKSMFLTTIKFLAGVCAVVASFHPASPPFVWASSIGAGILLITDAVTEAGHYLVNRE